MSSPTKSGIEKSRSRSRWQYLASPVLGFWVTALPFVGLASDDRADRLTAADDVRGVPESSPANSERAVAIHAAGAVTLSFPATWTIKEVPVRREVRLTLRPSEDSERSAASPDEFWLAYHHHSGLKSDAQQLHHFAKRRVAAITRAEVHIDDLHATTIDAFPAVEVTFQYELLGTQRIAKYAAAATPWGHVELQATAVADDWADREEIFNEIVASVHLAPPSVTQPTAVSDVQDASPILGSWKSYHGRMRLVNDGRIEVVSDRPFSYESTEGSTATGKKIAGQFRAQQDLLFIEWDDGSQLNFRWRLAGNRLLLTDHNGRMTQLRVILE